MNVLSLAERAQIVGALTEGVGIRACARLYGRAKHTVNDLALKVGNGSHTLHNALMIGIRCNRIEVDEIHSFVQGKKNPHPLRGQQYTFLALDSTSRAIVGFYVGKRTIDSTEVFIADIRQRVIGSPEINSDCFAAYLPAVAATCGDSVSYGRISKSYGKMYRAQITGRQETISTQRIERQNLTLRNTNKRFSRRSWGFSKTYRHHVASVALYVFHYNFCRVHEALKMTPAMQLGLSDHAWSISELVSAALDGVIGDEPIDVEAEPIVAPKMIVHEQRLIERTVTIAVTDDSFEIPGECQMARIRTIKPEFFRHEGLFEAEQQDGFPLRLAFAGLWTAADREGRFRWAPRQLKLDCLPYDELDFSRVLDALAMRGFIAKYAVDGREYGFIPSWSNHQIINNRERASDIPEPNEVNTLTRAARVTDAQPTPLRITQGEGKGREHNAAPIGARPDAETDLYRRGQEVLGGQAGGMVKNLIKAKGGDVALARAALETASTKANPREYVGGVLRGQQAAQDSFRDPMAGVL